MTDPSRGPVLPDGMKELAQIFELQKQTDSALKNIAIDIAAQGRRLAPVIFARLRRAIDEDLLFSDQAELVMPEITAMSAKVLRELSPNAPATRLDSWMVEIVSREVYAYIRKQPNKSGRG
jgi:hypothetical protein